MRYVLHLTTHLNRGGIATYIVSLAKALSEKGQRVCVASSGGDMESELAAAGISHLELDIKTKSEISPKLFIARRKLIKFISDNKINLIHAHTRVTQVLADSVSRKTKVPYVTTCHGFFKPRFFRRIHPCWGERVIAISEAVKDHLINDFGLREDKIALVYNGVDLRRFPHIPTQGEKALAKKALGLDGKKVIGIITRFSKSKGAHFLIESLPHILKRHDDAALLIVGDGEEGNDLKKLAFEMGLNGRVIFREGGSKTFELLSAMDVFAFPTMNEGLGLSAIEALSCGVPVVASSVGGVPEVVEDKKTGFLFKAGDVKDLADAILKVFANDLGEGVDMRARASVETKFDIKRMADEVSHLYSTI